jgi:hypothetical protein
MIFKSEAQLRVEIDRLTEQLTAVMAANADEYLAQDIALSNAVEEVKKAYSKKDWIRLKNAASYITEIKNDVAPVEPDPEADWIEVSQGIFGVPFPPNWGMPKDIAIPRGKYTIFGAPQKTGKTRATISALLYLADIGHKVSFMSGEMPTSQIWLLAWMQKQFLDYRNSFGEFEARTFMASKDPRHIGHHESFKNFRREYGKKMFVLYTPGWSAKRIVYGHKLAQNHFGRPATVWATDYAQIIGKDPSARDMRESQINNSLYFTVATGVANVAHILVSQVNEMGVTAESTQYERDAGMVVNFIRETNKDTGEKSAQIKIHVKHSRSTASGIFTRWMDVKSGAIVPDAGYIPKESQGRFDD